MTDLLRRGRLEVETDLLLGVEEVLLLEHVAVAVDESGAVQARSVTATTATTAATVPVDAKPAQRGFDAALFATGGAGSRTAPAPSASASPPTPRPATPKLSSTPSSTPSSAQTSTFSTAPQSAAPSTGTPLVPIADRIVPPSAGSKAEQLALLDAMHARECPHCASATAHTRLVFGEGNADAELVFIGDAPTEAEDQLGKPFVGRAGDKLNEMISAMGLTRDDVYVANVLKSRTPENRTPLPQEIERCGPYLLAQLAIISPKAIVTLGGPATKLMLASELGITRLRGVTANIRIGAAAGEPVDVPVMPTLHPAYLLRNYTPETRMQVWEDLKKVLAILGRPVPQRK